jgi:DNA polymerase III delta subunit
VVKTLTGGNEYLLRAELEKLVAGFVATHGDIAVEYLEGKEADFDRIRESLQSTPFLATRKMVVLRNPSANKTFLEQAEDLIKGLPESTDLLVVEPTLDKRLSYYKLLKKATEFHEYTDLDQRHLEQWLIDCAKIQGSSLNDIDARFLVERVGINQQLLAHELEKLLLYDPVITHETILLLTEPTPQSTIFELLDAAFNGNTKRALAIYRDQREQKVESAKIIAMLTWQLAVFAFIKTAAGRSIEAIAKEARLNPYVVRKSQPAAANISYERLKQLISGLVLIDMRSKLESIDLDEILQLYLIKIAV